MPTWTRAELEDAFTHYQRQVVACTASGDWSRFAELFTEDATYVEHAYGNFAGRDQIREWVVRTMTTFPGSEMVAFPVAWHVIDEARGWVICEIRNPFRDPGDGSVIAPTNLTILRYAGDGLWREEEDVYNPATFLTAVTTYLRACTAHGTLTDEAREWAARLRIEL